MKKYIKIYCSIFSKFSYYFLPFVLYYFILNTLNTFLHHVRYILRRIPTYNYANLPLYFNLILYRVPIIQFRMILHATKIVK